MRKRDPREEGALAILAPVLPGVTGRELDNLAEAALENGGTFPGWVGGGGRAPSPSSFGNTFAQETGAGEALLEGLSDPRRWLALAEGARLRVLAGLWSGLVGGDGIYGAVRLRLCCGERTNSRSELTEGLIAALCAEATCSSRLREESRAQEARVSLLGAILGRVCRAGVGVSELRSIILRLRSEHHLGSRSLLAALRIMAGSDELEGVGYDIAAALRCESCRVGSLSSYASRAFFSFSGDCDGLVSTTRRWPCCGGGDYQLSFIFRMEDTFPQSPGRRSGIFSFRSSSESIEYFVEGRNLCVEISSQKAVGDSYDVFLDSLMPEGSLLPGRWYEVVIEHGSRAREGRTLFKGAQKTTVLPLLVFLDGVLVCEKHAPLPTRDSCNAHENIVCHMSMGDKLDGQIAGLMLGSLQRKNVHDDLAAAPLRCIVARTHLRDVSGKSSPIPPGSLHESPMWRLRKSSELLLGFISDKDIAKTPLSCVPDVLWLPDTRSFDGRLCDFAGGRPATLSKNSFCWETCNAKDALASVGGMSALLPLFGVTLFLSDRNKRVECDNDHTVEVMPELLPIDSLFNLVASYLYEHEGNQADMERIAGLQIIEMCMLKRPRSSSKSSPPDIVKGVYQLCISCKENSRLYLDVLRKFAWTFRCWSCVPLDLRPHIFMELASIFYSNPNLSLLREQSRGGLFTWRDVRRTTLTCLSTLLELRNADNDGCYMAIQTTLGLLANAFSDLSDQSGCVFGRLLLLTLSTFTKLQVVMGAVTLCDLINQLLRVSSQFALDVIQGMESACEDARSMVGVSPMELCGTASFSGALLRAVRLLGVDDRLQYSAFDVLWTSLIVEMKDFVSHCSNSSEPWSADLNNHSSEALDWQWLHDRVTNFIPVLFYESLQCQHEVSRRSFTALLEIAALLSSGAIEESTSTLLVLVTQNVQNLKPNDAANVLLWLLNFYCSDDEDSAVRRKMFFQAASLGHFGGVLPECHRISPDAGHLGPLKHVAIHPGMWHVSLFEFASLPTSAHDSLAHQFHAQLLAIGLYEDLISFEEVEFACALPYASNRSGEKNYPQSVFMLRDVAKYFHHRVVSTVGENFPQNGCKYHNLLLSALNTALWLCIAEEEQCLELPDSVDISEILFKVTNLDGQALSRHLSSMLKAVLTLVGPGYSIRAFFSETHDNCCSSYSHMFLPELLCSLYLLRCANPLEDPSAPEGAVRLSAALLDLVAHKRNTKVEGSSSHSTFHEIREGCGNSTGAAFSVDDLLLLILRAARAGLLEVLTALRLHQSLASTAAEDSKPSFCGVGKWSQALYGILTHVDAYFQVTGESSDVKIPEPLRASLRAALVEGSDAVWEDSAVCSQCGPLIWTAQCSFFGDAISQDLQNLAHPISQKLSIYLKKMFEMAVASWHPTAAAAREGHMKPEFIDFMEADAAAVMDGLYRADEVQRLQRTKEDQSLNHATMRAWASLQQSLFDPSSPWTCDSPPHYVLSHYRDSMMRRSLFLPSYAPQKDYRGASYEERDTTAPDSGETGAGTADISLILPPLPSPSKATDNGGTEDSDEELESEDETQESELEPELQSYSEMTPHLNFASDSWVDAADEIDESVNFFSGTFFDSDETVRGRWKEVEFISSSHSVCGCVLLTERRLLFLKMPGNKAIRKGSSVSLDSPFLDRVRIWYLCRLQRLYLKRYLLCPRAVELFWIRESDTFLAFRDQSDRKSFLRVMQRMRSTSLPLMEWSPSAPPRKILSQSRLTDAWRRREISNMEYIVNLNLLAGRTYNVVSQYPVFPWILADYQSDRLDFSKPETFRDLSKPVGALNPDRLDAFLERYESFSDEVIPKFMYGSHYSSSGTVLHFLLRQEPFTSLHVDLQGGRFDCPDRLFFDIAQSWRGSLTSMTDVKELVPELFYCPEVLLNSQKLPLGKLQESRGTVGDVKLPPWAASPQDFIRLHRRALESEYVSSQLHHWIDLIFGFQQRGKAAAAAHNVFYYLTYERGVNLDAVNDPAQREAMETQISHFGQTPSQLFREPHPARLSRDVCIAPCLSFPDRVKVFYPQRELRGPISCAGRISYIFASSSRIVAVYDDAWVALYRLSSLPDGRGVPFRLSLEKQKLLTNFGISRALKEQNADGCKFCVFSDSASGSNGTDYLLSSGHWDSSIRMHAISGPSCFNLVAESSGLHLGRVTCMVAGGGFLLSGADDCRICLWVLCQDKTALATVMGTGEEDRISQRLSTDERARVDCSGNGHHLHCHKVLRGHESPIRSLAFSPDLGLCVSGADDGRIVVHNVRGGGDFVRDYFLPHLESREKDCYPSSGPASVITMTCHGAVVVHRWADLAVFSYSMSGSLVARGLATSRLNALVPSRDGEIVVCGGIDGRLSLVDSETLEPLGTIETGRALSPISCLSLSQSDQYIILGHDDGEMGVATDVETRLNMISSALEKAFLG